MAQQAHTVRSLEHKAREAARNHLVHTAETQPALMATHLVKQPELSNGLRDFDYIVEALIKGGQRDAMMRLAESRLLSSRTRTVLVSKLLIN